MRDPAVLAMELHEALLREKQRNARLSNKLQTVCAEVHALSARLHRLEYGIRQDGIGELNAYGVREDNV